MLIDYIILWQENTVEIAGGDIHILEKKIILIKVK